jgi:hypothetical protein
VDHLGLEETVDGFGEGMARVTLPAPVSMLKS